MWERQEGGGGRLDRIESTRMINHVERDDNNNNNTEGKKKPFNKWALISRQCNKLVVM